MPAIEGKKLDDGKAPVYRGVLVRFPRALLEVAKVSAAGATKYAVPVENASCLTVPDGLMRYRDAGVRHMLMEVIEGPVNTERGGGLPDEGVELLHAAQHAWDALCALEILLIEREASQEDQIKGVAGEIAEREI